MLIDPCFSWLSPLNPPAEGAWFSEANHLINQGVTHLLVAPPVKMAPTFPGAMDALALQYQTLLDRSGIPLRIYASQLVIPTAPPVPVGERVPWLFADLNGRYVLVAITPETTAAVIYPQLFEWLKEDVRPILVGMETAAPAVQAKWADWAQQGCYFLASAASIMGQNGPSAKQAVWQALTHGEIQLIGSGLPAQPETALPAALAMVTERLGKSYGDDLRLNAKALLNGEPLITQFHVTKPRWRLPFLH